MTLDNLFTLGGELLGRVFRPSLSPSADDLVAIVGFEGNDVVLHWSDDNGYHLTVLSVRPGG